MPDEVPADVTVPMAYPIVVCDGSKYDPKTPYLLATLWNHTVHPVTEADLGFDATSKRIISTVSLHDRCAFLVCSERHESALQNLGYQVVRWGQTMAFPMCEEKIKSMGNGDLYSGALTTHSFTEPLSLHSRTVVATGAVTGDGSFDGLNHLSGAYIPLVLALKSATEGDTHINLGTMNSGVNLQTHNMDMVVSAGNFTTLACTDGIGGSIMPDNKVIQCKAVAGQDPLPLVVGSKHVRPGFDKLIQKMSGPPSSYIAELGDKVSSTIGNGIFADYQKKLETDIRRFANKKMALTKEMTTHESAVATEGDELPCQIDMNDLSPLLQTSYCTAAMVGMQQPYPIGAPTVIVDAAAAKDGDTVANDGSSEYGERFSTCCYALESHFDMTSGRDIHPFFGISAITHSLILGQITSHELEKIVEPFANANSKFLRCKDASCGCNTADSDKSTNTPPLTDNNETVIATVSAKVGRMLHGVSQNIALSNTVNIPKPFGTSRNANNKTPTIKTQPIEDTKCTATTDFSGTCKCRECTNTTKLLNFTQLVTSCTHAFQKCDNYVADQTACAITPNGVLQYMPTESMLPFMTITKSIMMKTGPLGPDDIQTRVGMNTDDCENCAFQGRSVLATLLTGSQCIQGEHFHNMHPIATTGSTCTVQTDSPAGGIGNTVANKATHDETIRRMRIGNLPKQDQRRILLAAEVIGQKVICNLGYFVTGSPSQSNDSVHTASATEFTKGTTCSHTAYAPETSSSMLIDMPSDVGSAMQLIGSKPSGQRISQRMTTNSEGGGLSGHCTCTLSVLRKDGFLHTDLVENTGYVIMGKGDIPCEVKHRGVLTASGAPDNSDEAAEKIGYFKGPVLVDNAVDVTVKGLLSTHVQTIAAGLQVPGSTMRPSMFMGTSEQVSANMDTFYKKIVSTGGYQCVQLDHTGAVQPGADVKKLVNQKVIPVVSLATAKLGEKAVRNAMGAAKIAMVQVVDHMNAAYVQFGEDCTHFRQAMAPPRASIKLQDTAMLGKLGSPMSLKVNFPDDHALVAQYGDASRTFFVTHVAQDDSAEGHKKVLSSIATLVKHKNKQFVNVRFAKPIVTASGEILTLYRIYGVPKDIM